VLNVRRFGEGPELVALHGFTHTGSQFAEFADLVGRTVIAPDLPGHGGSREASAKVPDVIAAVAAVLEGTPQAPLLGYSQGGRIALLTALAHPHLVPAMVVVSAGAGIDDTSARERRLQADRRRAASIREGDLESFLADWTTSGITSTTHLEPGRREADLDVRRDNSVEGLAAALDGYGQGSQPSVWSRLGDITCPMLVVAGSDDARYRQVASRLVERIHRAELCVIAGAGHNPLMDRPVGIARAVSAFLGRLG
jgi:2-succinyl-6-hydroxy-2,4-cyclohexadiene-1-carboxylate synthase